MRLKFLICVLLASANAFACINVSDSKLVAEIEASRANSKKMSAIIKRLEVDNASKANAHSTNDLAVAYIYAGEYQKAVGLLREIELKQPGLAKTAANLGTAFELLGKNEEALTWIKQGIILDKTEHQGTEWLHVKILEAKIGIQNDPNWSKKNTILGIDFMPDSSVGPKIPKSFPTDPFAGVLTLRSIEKALDYQLKERVKFVAAPDYIMSELYNVRGHVAYLLNDGKQIEYYLAAQYFGKGPKPKY